MSTENENLFEGLEIMSPEELNSAVASKEESENEIISSPGEDESELFKPVSTETGEGANANPPDSKPTKPNLDVSKNEAIYKGLMKELLNSGILTAAQIEELDSLPGNLDTIKQLVDKTVKHKFQSAEKAWKDNMPAAKKRFLEIEDAFDETDQAILMAQRLEFFDTVNETELAEDENLQKQIYYDLLKSKNFSDQDALDAIEDAVSVGKLKDKALKAIPQLKADANNYVEQIKVQKNQKTQAEIKELGYLNPTYSAKQKITGKTKASKETTESSVNLLSLQSILNSQLQDVISANMGDGSSKSLLNYRTGRFASTAEVKRLSISRDGMITAFYDYMKNPYATFSTGGKQEYPRSRDPKLLISRSIRQIAAQVIDNRLRAVLV